MFSGIQKFFTMFSSRPSFTVVVLAFSAMVSLAVIATCYGHAQDNDQWWLLSTGREIAENGIPVMNPFSVWDDQAIVIQQWIPAVIDYLIYDLFGSRGIGVLVLIQALVFSLLLVWFARICTIEDRTHFVWIATLVPVVLGCATSYISVRPQIWTMIFYMLIFIVLQKYRQGATPKILLLLLIIMIVHINFHMSLALMDIAIVLVFAIPNFLASSFREMIFGRYNRLWLLLAATGMAVAALANPYGIDGTMYFFSSFDAADYGKIINEMRPLSPSTAGYGLCALAMVAVGGAGIARNRGHVDIPATLLYLIACYMSFQYVRNVWLVAIFAFVLFSASGGISVDGEHIQIASRTNGNLPDQQQSGSSPLIKRIWQGASLPVIWGTILVIGFLGVCWIADVLYEGDGMLVGDIADAPNTPVLAADYMEAASQDNGNREISVFTHFDAGGYLEWRGFKVSMDARPELWNSLISKNEEDRYTEYVDMDYGDISPDAYLADKSFVFMIVNDDTDMYDYLSGSSDYRAVLVGNGYTLFCAEGYDDSGAIAAGFSGMLDEGSEDDMVISPDGIIEN